MNLDLKTAREAAGYSIEEISRRLNIRKQYLIALEEGELDSLPGAAYAEGYKRMYYDFLNLDLPSKCAKEANHLGATEAISKAPHRLYIVPISILLTILVVLVYDALMSTRYSTF